MRNLIITPNLASIDADYTPLFTRMAELGVVPGEGSHLFFLNSTRLTADSVRRDLSRFLHLKDSVFVAELAVAAEALA